MLPDPALLKAIRDIPPLQNATELQLFMGLASYYRSYVRKFVPVASPLHSLTQKVEVHHWTPDCQDAFTSLKHYFTTPPIMAFPEFSLPFWLNTDASLLCLGAILAQVQDRRECIVCCASWAVNQFENNYPTTKLECLAIIWAVEKF